MPSVLLAKPDCPSALNHAGTNGRTSGADFGPNQRIFSPDFKNDGDFRTGEAP